MKVITQANGWSSDFYFSGNIPGGSQYELNWIVDIWKGVWNGSSWQYVTRDGRPNVEVKFFAYNKTNWGCPFPQNPYSSWNMRWPGGKFGTDNAASCADEKSASGSVFVGDFPGGGWDGGGAAIYNVNIALSIHTGSGDLLPTPNPTPSGGGGGGGGGTPEPTPPTSGGCNCRAPAEGDTTPPTGIQIGIEPPSACYALVPSFRSSAIGGGPIQTAVNFILSLLGIGEIRIPGVAICVYWVTFSIYLMGIDVGGIVIGIAGLVGGLTILRIVGRV